MNSVTHFDDRLFTMPAYDLKGMGRAALSPTRSIVNIPTQVKNGAGNGFSRPPVILLIESPVSSAGIIFTSPCCNAHLKKRGSKSEFLNMPDAIHCVIHLPHTCWRTDTISERFKNCWGITT